jgi:hypothetical protein
LSAMASFNLAHLRHALRLNDTTTHTLTAEAAGV